MSQIKNSCYNLWDISHSEVYKMKKTSRSKRARLILGIAAVLISVLLVWLLSGLLGGMAMLFLALGGGIFIWLNPELMRGE